MRCTRQLDKPLFAIAVLIGGFFSALRGIKVTTPSENLNAVVSSLHPGDTLQLHGGVYPYSLNNSIPGGTGWSAPVTLMSFPGEKATIQAPSGSSSVILLQGGSKQYIIFDSIVIDASGVPVSGGGAVKLDRPGVGQQAAHHIRFLNCEIKNCGTTAIVPTYSSDYNEFIGCYIHDNGMVLDQYGHFGYGWYMRASYNLIDRCTVTRNGSSGIQIYSGAAATEPPIGNIIRNSKFNDNCVKSWPQLNAGAGIVVASGSGARIESNEVSRNRVGVFISGASNTSVLNNNICDNPQGAIEDSSSSTSKSGNSCGGTPTTSTTDVQPQQQTQTQAQEPSPRITEVSMPSGLGTAALIFAVGFAFVVLTD